VLQDHTARDRAPGQHTDDRGDEEEEEEEEEEEGNDDHSNVTIVLNAIRYVGKAVITSDDTTVDQPTAAFLVLTRSCVARRSSVRTTART
jgi:hypothetical protein